MKFLAIDHSAAGEITASRVLQSAEFEAGAALAEFLRDPNLEVPLGPRMNVLRHDDGVFLLGPKPNLNQFIVVDLDSSGLFRGDLAEFSLFDAQKLLRFAVKHWDNLRLSASEWIVPNSTKAVIFPHPISQQTRFRISIELHPDAKRQSRRASEDRSILVYRSGFDEGAGAQEATPVQAFRAFLEARKKMPTDLALMPSAAVPNISSMSVTTLDDSLAHVISPFQGYAQWIELLTRKQKGFVLGELYAPHRIEGPAGTGKTLCLVLKAIAGLKRAEDTGSEHRALFITHSEATRRSVSDLVQTNDPGGYIDGDAHLKLQSLKVSTLQQLCGELLQRDLSESEFLDRDAMESKQLQVWHVEDALKAALSEEYPTYKKFLSAGFDAFLSTTNTTVLAEMFQHEISVVIKGRAEESLENYRKLPRLRYGLPTENNGDRNFIWQVYRRYQSQLLAAAQFDTDDIVLTTIGQLDTPIWRRRRVKEGYDAIYIDETHLFNVNELSLFHYLPRQVAQFPIAYSVDRTQAIGDRGWSEEAFDEVLSPAGQEGSVGARTEVQKIFRCSPDIVDLAFSVTSSGATLFTNFNDPLRLASSAFTSEEERSASHPCMLSCPDDEAMIAEAFRRAEVMAQAMGASRCDVAIITFTDELLARASAFARDHNKPVEILKQRGDAELVRRAQQTRRFVVSTPDFVGGLEFSGVVLVGVDDGRVPPTRTTDSTDSRNFLSYSAHNRLYVAITRAKYRVMILVAKDRGPSSLLANATASGLLPECSQQGN
jgi:UvrD/REP helicase N-terminal domain/UvrD-like helicase C-terminal domain